MIEEIKQAIHQRISAPEAEIALSVLTLQLTSEGYNAGDLATAVADLLNAGEDAGGRRGRTLQRPFQHRDADGASSA